MKTIGEMKTIGIIIVKRNNRAMCDFAGVQRRSTRARPRVVGGVKRVSGDTSPDDALCKNSVNMNENERRRNLHRQPDNGFC